MKFVFIAISFSKWIKALFASAFWLNYVLEEVTTITSPKLQSGCNFIKFLFFHFVKCLNQTRQKDFMSLWRNAATWNWVGTPFSAEWPQTAGRNDETFVRESEGNNITLVQVFLLTHQQNVNVKGAQERY